MREHTGCGFRPQRTTVYLAQEDIRALDAARAHLERTERRRVDRSDLIRRAIRDNYSSYISEAEHGR